MQWGYIQDIISLLAACGALLGGIYIQSPMQWEYVFLIILAGFGALAIIVWFVLSVKI
jgi:hypothetical protein